MTMGKFLSIAALVALSGCATTSKIVNCDNAAKVRAAAALAIQAVDRACPISLTSR